MARAFECEVCGALFPGDRVSISKEISHRQDTIIELRVAMYGRREDMYGDEEVFDPDVCVSCQINGMKALIREYERND